MCHAVKKRQLPPRLDLSMDKVLSQNETSTVLAGSLLNPKKHTDQGKYLEWLKQAIFTTCSTVDRMA
jgi:hypothetical protein